MTKVRKETQEMYKKIIEMLAGCNLKYLDMLAIASQLFQDMIECKGEIENTKNLEMAKDFCEQLKKQMINNLSDKGWK